MKVWIVNPFDNLPDEGYRPQRYWLMSEAFARVGHEVTFWTQDWSHAKKMRRSVRRNPETPFSVKAIHVPGYTRNICLRRIWSHAKFAANWSRAAFRENPPDLIVVSSPPLLIGREVRRFCQRCGAKYVVDVMDAWPETFERVLPRWMLGWARRIVRRNYCGAAGVTAVAERYVDLVGRYGAKCPVRLFHHGISIDRSRTRRILPIQAPATPLRIAYVGNMSLSYDLATAVEAVKRDASVSLDLAGSGPDEPSLRKRAAGCDRIRFHGYLDEANLRALLSSADVGLVPMFDESCVGVPYKLADYAAAGLPVINSLTGETARLLAETGTGVSYAAGDVASLLTAVKSLRTLDWPRLVAGASALAERFDATAIYRDYVAWTTDAKINRRLSDVERTVTLPTHP